MWGGGPIRLSVRPRPPGGQGQPYPDAVVAEARALVEGTCLSQAEIAARVGISHMSVCRWARAGGWRRPRGTQRPFDELGRSPKAMQRYATRTRPWRLLEEAEGIVAGVEAGEADLDRLERALALVLEARELHAKGVGPRRP
jgi:hypothetical protein